jgi:site-specific DNA-methyltransferase (cytosine-N4-specific)
LRPRTTTPRTEITNVRLTREERSELEAAAKKKGFPSISEYIRFLHNSAEHADHAVTSEAPEPFSFPSPKLFSRTELGRIYHGDSLGLMHNVLEKESVDLIMTSPPFGLVRKKSYGNEDADRYLKWFRPFAEGFRKVLKPSGSLVIDIGGAWKVGTPTRSLYHFDLLIMLCKEFGFHLCQEHYWWNPAKLPTPAEWVNVRRLRVKDAVNCVWWLSPTPWPKANNRRVLAPYSDSMMDLFANGYEAKLRPSGHDISNKFGRNNGGSVPPNLLALANTESSGQYQDYCRQKGLPIHPARFPTALPEYFIRMLSDPGDVVFDPFAGSCVTGEAAENSMRQWIGCELSESYLEGALARFAEPRTPRVKKTVFYKIAAPCAVPVDEDEVALPEDGGRQRPSSVGLKVKPAKPLGKKSIGEIRLEKTSRA